MGGCSAERRRYPCVPYWFLSFQIVSCSCSALVLTVFVPERLFPVGMPESHDWAFHRADRIPDRPVGGGPRRGTDLAAALHVPV
jgi:hypothetical protein